MNKIFKVIWSKSKQCYIVVSEIAKNKTGKKKIVVASILAALAMQSGLITEVMAADPPSARLADAAEAAGTNGVAIGSSARSKSNQSVAIGYFSVAQAPGANPENPATAVGAGANADGAGAVALGLSANATGANAVALGGGSNGGKNKTEATGDKSTAVGYNAKSTTNNDTAVGSGVNASGGGSTVIGYNSTVTGNQAFGGGSGLSVAGGGSVGLGYNSSTTSDKSIAIGHTTKATQANTVAIGASATAAGLNSVAMGNSASITAPTAGTTLGGQDSIAIGSSASAQQHSSISVGLGASSDGVRSVAIGPKASATDEDTIAIGTGGVGADKNNQAVGANGGGVGSTLVNGVSGVSLYYGAKSSGKQSIAIGYIANAKESGIAFGNYAVSDGGGGTAMGKSVLSRNGGVVVGQSSNAIGKNSVAYGNTVKANGETSTAMGYSATADGQNAVAVGYSNTASNKDSVAIGNTNQSTNQGSVTVGYGNNATNDNAVAIGRSTNASGLLSTAIGNGATSQGTYDVAIGSDVTANGNNSVAIGRNAKTSNTSSLAIGVYGTKGTSATGDYSIAMGRDVTASAESAIAIGKDAVSNKKNAVALGSGSDTSSAATAQSSAIIAGKSYSWSKGVLSGADLAGMQVSVGKSGAERQIKNVAAGEVSANSTDAINGSQLYAVASGLAKDLKVPYVSINSSATGANSNFDNDGAKGANSIAIGPSSTVTRQNGIAIGSGAQSLSEDSVVIGRNAKAETKPGAGLTTTSRAIVIGSNSRVAADITQGIAIGSGNSPDEGAVVTGDQSIAIGGNVKVDGHAAIAIGGDDARKAANQLVSYTNKNDAEVTGTLQNAISDLTGYNLNDYKGTTASHAGVAYGASALAGNAGVAIGTAADSMTRKNDKGQVVNNNPVTNAVAIGTAARANFDNSVAIGGGSNTDHYATKQVNAIIDGVEVKWSGGENISPGDVVSFGAKGFERQLKNVAPGEVSQTSTDAVNGSQIYSLARKVTNIMNGGSGSVVNVNATGEPLSKVVTGTGASKVEKYYRTIDVEDDGTLKNGAVAQTPTALALVNVDQTNVNQQTQTPRTLGNVANGVKDNDAVNVSQLNAAKVKYFSVNSSDAGNINNDGATGTDAIAIGPSAVSNAVGSVALGKDAKANGDFTVALGGGNWQFKGAQANGVGTTALGSSTKTKVGTNYQIAIGFGATTSAESALALGYNADASAQNAIALGRSASTAGQDAVALGSSSQAKGDSGLAIGNGAQANSNSVISLGYQANNGASNNTYGVAIGWAAGMQSNGLNNVGVGTNAGRQVIGNNNTSLGNGAGNIANTKIYTSESIMLGTGAKVVGSSATKSIDNVIAIGKNTSGSASSAIAVGINAGSSAENGVAIGPNSNTSAYNGIALGSFSEASTAAGVQGYNVNTNRTDKYAGLTDIALTSKLGAVSVGNSTMTRQITGVAAGTNDTDAVNIAQLKSVNLAFTGNTGSGDVNLANSKLSINGDNTYIKTAANGKELTISPNVQNITLNNGRASASTGLADASNVAQAINNVVSGVQLDIIANKGTKTGSVNLSNQKLTVTGGNGIRTDIYSNTSGQNLVIGLEPELVNATTKGIGLSGDSGSTGLKYLKDGDAVFKVYGDGNLVTTTGSATGVKVSVDSTKVKDLAVEAVTVSKANTVDNPITVTSTTSTNSKDYAIGIDTTKLAAKTNLAYTANGAAAKTVSLAKGLNFVNGTNTVATVDSDGKVSFDINKDTKDSISKSATAVGRTITLNADSGTGSSQSLSNGNVSFAVSGATGDYISTQMDGSAVKVSTKRATIDSNATTGVASVTGNDGLATAKNVADAINKAADAAKAGAAWNITTNSSTTDKTAVKGGDTVDLINGDNIVITQDGTDKKKITVATKKDITVDSVTAGNTVINTSGLTNGTTAITGTGITTDKVTVGGISIDKTAGINAGGKVISNVASGNVNNNATDNSNAANIGDVKQAVANLSQNLGITDGTNNGTVDLKNQKLNVAGANGVTATINNQTITVGLDANTVNATTKGIGLTADTGSTGNKYLKDGDVSFAVTGDGNLVSTTATTAGVKVAVDAAKVKDLAVAAVTVSKDTQADNPITVTPTAGTNSKDYAIGIDTTKLAAKTDLTYRANSAADANAKKVSLSKGLDFVDGGSTVATVDNDGKVSFDLNTATKNQINTNTTNITANTGKIATNTTNIATNTTALARNISLGADTGTASSQSLSTADVAFNVKGATGDFVSTNMNGNTVEISTKRATINSNATTGEASVTGNDGLATAQNVADAINKAADAAKAGAAWNITTNSSTTDKTAVKGGDTVDLVNGDNIEITQDGTDKKKITVATKKDITVDSVTANNKVTVGSGANKITLDGTDGSVTGKAFTGTTFTGTSFTGTSFTAGNTVINTNGLTNGTTAITGTGVTTDNVTVGGISIDKTTGINAGNKVISNVASGGTTLTNAANIGDVQNAVANLSQNLNITDGTHDGTVDLKNQKLNVAGANGVTATVNNQTITVGLDANTVNATTKGIGLTADTGSTGNKYLKDGDVSFAVTGDGSLVSTTATAAGVKVAVNSATITAGTDGTITGPTTDGVATAKNVADAINAAKKASKTEITANTGEAANVTTGNVTLTSTTAADGHTIYDVKLNDKVTLGSGANAVTIDGTTGAITGKTATIGGVTVNGTANTIGGLSNTTWNGTAVSGRAATEDQLKAATGATTLKFTGDVATNTGSVNLKDDTFGIKGDSKYISTDVNGKNVNLTVSEAEVKKSAVAAVTVSTDTTDANNPLTVTPTTSADGTTKDYKVTIDGTKIANKTNLSYKANNGTAKQVSLADGLDFTNGTLTTASIDNKGVVKYDVNTASITAGADGTITGPTTDGVATAQNVADAINVAKKASKTEITANTGEAANATTGNVTLTSTTAADGHTIYDVKLNDKVTLGTGANAVIIDGTTGAITGKTATIGGVTVNGTANTIGGLSNTTWNGTATTGRAATEDQLKAVADAAGSQTWEITADKKSGTSGAQTGTKKNATVGKDETVELVAGDNLTINQDERKFTYSLNKDLAGLTSVSIGTGTTETIKLDGATGKITAKNAAIGGVTIDGDNKHVNGLSNTTWNGTATTGRAATEDQLKAVAETAKTTTDAVNLKFSGDTNTSPGVVNLKDDTLGVVGDGKYVSTDANGKNLTVKVSEAEVKKSAVAAVTVSTDTTDANNPLTVTPTTSADGTTKNYKVTIDGTKIANKTNLSYKANDGTPKQVSLADGLNFKNGTLTTASIDDNGVVKYDVNTASITAGADGTITGPTTDGVATAQNVADAINVAKKASKTEITANTGEAANATTGNVTLTSTTAADGHTIYDVKLNDKVTLGSGANAVTIDGTAGKATIGSSVINGVNNTFTTGGAKAVTLDGDTGTITGTTANIGGVTVNGTANTIGGLSNTTWNGTATTGRAATEDQLKAVADAAGSQTWEITADKKAGTSGAQTGTKENAKVGKDDKVSLIAGENLTVDQAGKNFTYSLNKDLVKMNSATFEATGGKTTVIKGDSIVQTDGANVNTSNATSNTITDGTNTSAITAGKGQIGSVGIDGIASKITTGGANAVVINGADGTVKTGNVTVTGGTTNDITGLSNTTLSATDFATKGRAATEEQLKAATGATTLKFTGDVATNTGSVNLKDDTFGIKGDGKYISTDVNGKNVNLTVSEAEVKKSAVAAVTVSTDTTDANNPLTVTPTTSADGTTKDYKVTIDGTKIANKTNLSYKANGGTAKQVSLADGLNFKNGTLTTASIDDAGVVKYDVNTASITAGADGTITGPTTDGVATAQNVADAINVAKKASKTEITANTGEAANATTGNVTLTSTTAADGHTIYDVKLNDKVTLGSGANAVTIDGTAGKATIGSSIVDGVNSTFTTGGANAVKLDGAAGTIKTGTVTVTGGTTNDITGLSNTTVTSADFATKGRAATEEQLKAVGEQTWQITADKDATTSGAQTGTKKNAKVGKDDKVQLIAGENLTVNQNERDFTYSLNKDLVKMNSATFEVTGGRTTVIKGDSIVQTDGTKVNTSTAGGSTVADGTKSTETTADGQVIKDGAKSNKSTVDSNVIDDGNGNVNTSNATSNTITDGTNTSTVTAGKAQIGTVGIDGVASKITTGGANAVVINGADGTVKTGTVTVIGGTTNDITGLSNTTVTAADFATKGRAATEEQLKAVGEQTWQITADKDATTSGVQTGTKKDAKVGKDDKVQLIAGENLTVNQNERDFTYSLNKDLVKMNSATFEATGGKTTVIKGDSIVQTDGTKVNTSTAAGNTVVDGAKSTATTADGITVTTANGNTNYAADGVRINTTGKTPVSLTDAGLDNGNNVIKNVASGHVNNDATDNTNAANIADVKKATTTVTANAGEAANATTGNVTLTSTTAADGHTIYDVKLNDKVTLGSGANAVTIDGTAGKATFGSSVVDGVNNTFTTGGANAVKLDGAAGTIKTGTVTVTGGTTNDITGLSNTTVTAADFATKGRAATEEQLKAVGEQTWQITADKDATTSGAQTGTKKDAKVGKNDKVQLIAGENMTVNQNERDFTFTLNKDLVKMNSATFEATGGKTTVIKGDSIVQTDGTKVNTSTAGGNTVADGTKSTETTAAGQVIKDGAKSNKSTVDSNVIDDGTGNVNTSNATSNTITDGTNTSTITAGKATIGSSIVDGVNNTFTTGGANAVKLDGVVGTIKTGTVTVTGGTTNDITGLSNTTVTATDFATKGRAATEEQLKAVGEQTWQITADKDTTTSGAQTGTKKDAKVGKDDKVQLIAGENMTVNQNERDFTFILNKDLVKMNSATFLGTGTNTTVITGDSITQTAGTQTNTSTAGGNTVADGTKSTETTAAGQVIKDGAKSNKSTVDSNVIDDGTGNVNTSNATSNTITDGTNTSTITAGKATIGSSIVDGVNNTFTTGGANAVKLDGVAGTIKTGTVTITGGTTNDITGLSNTTVTVADFATKGRAATEEQLKAVGEQTWQITADKDATTSGAQTGTKKDAKVGKDDKVQLIAGENMTVNQNERDFTFTLNKDLVKMNSATFEVTGGKTTVIKGDSIVQTDGTKVNTSTAGGNTVVDGTKSTATTADGTTVTSANGNTKYAADGVRINTTGKNPVSLTDAGLDNGNNVIKNVASGHVNNDATDNTNAANIADVKKATTTVTANAGEAANATKGNVTLTSTTAADGHTIYDVKLNDKVTLGTGANAVTIDGTAGKATVGSSVVDGVNNTFTTGGAKAVKLDGVAGTIKTGTVTVTGGTTNDITGLSNTTVTSADFATKGRAATEEQLKAVGEQTWQITADKDATTSGAQTGTKKDAKVGKDDKVQLIAGENMTVNQNERDFTFTLNKDLVKMNSATFLGTGSNTTVITGNSITQTAGTQTNTSTAGGNTIADGTKSTETTAAGQVIKDGAKSNKSTVDSNVIDDGTGNVNTSNATSNTVTDGTNTTATTFSSVTVKDNAGNSTVITKDNITTGVGANKVTLDGTAGKATIGSSIVDGVNNTFTTGGANAVKLDGVAGTIKTGTVTVTGGTTNDITGLSNTTVNSADFATKGRAATEEQLKAVGEQTWQITADKDATTSGAQTGTKKDAKVGKNDKVQLIAGENMTVNQNERDFTFTLNKDLVKMNSATFLGTGSNTTVITGNSITQTAGTQTNTSTAAGNTIANGTKSTETTADGQVIKDGAKSNKSTVDSNVIDDGNGNVNTSNATSNTITDGTNTSTITAGKANIGNIAVDGVNNKITMGNGATPVTLDGANGHLDGLTNTTWVPGVTKATTGRAATEDQLQQVSDAVGAGWKVNTGTVAGSSGVSNGAASTKVSSGEEVKLQAGDNLVIDQNGKTVSYSLNKDLTKMNSATFEATGGKTTVIKGDSIVQTDGGKTNTSNAAGNTVVDGNKSTATTAAGTTITDGAKTNTSTADKNVIDDGAGNKSTFTKDGITITKTGKDTVSLTSDGLDNGKNKIVNVAAGVANTDAVNVGQLKEYAAKSTTELTANNGETAGSTKGNIVLTKTTAADGHTIYDNKLNDKITLGTDPTKAVTVDGTTGTVTGLTNKTWTPGSIVSGRAATEDQLKDAVADSGWKAAVDKEGSGQSTVVGTSPEKIKAEETVTFKAGNNMMVTQTGKSISYAVNPELTDMKSATFKDASGNTTVTNGNGITITPGSANPTNPHAGPVSLTKDGLNNGNNQIKGVAPGTDPTDAVNVSQLNASNANTSQAINQIAGEVQHVGAHAAAMAALKPIQYDPLEPTQVMAGVGNYRGETAAALGLAHYTNENTMFNVGVSVGGNHNMVNAGVTHKFGYSPEKKNIPDRYKAGPISSVYVMQDEVSSLKKENAEQKYVIADQAARLTTLEAENEQQRRELAETKKGLDDLKAAVDKLLASKG